MLAATNTHMIKMARSMSYTYDKEHKSKASIDDLPHPQAQKHPGANCS